MSEDIKSLSQIKRIQATSPQEILNLIIGLANANKNICELETALKVAVKALEWYATPGIHERWKAEEGLAEIKKLRGQAE